MSNILALFINTILHVHVHCTLCMFVSGVKGSTECGDLEVGEGNLKTCTLRLELNHVSLPTLYKPLTVNQVTHVHCNL